MGRTRNKIFGTNRDPCRKGALYTSGRFRRSLQMRDHPKTSLAPPATPARFSPTTVPVPVHRPHPLSLSTVYRAATFQIASMSSLLPWAISLHRSHPLFLLPIRTAFSIQFANRSVAKVLVTPASTSATLFFNSLQSSMLGCHHFGTYSKILSRDLKENVFCSIT